MQMFKQAEEMTKKVEAAYPVLCAWIQTADAQVPDEHDAG
jgi:hypothetical protein